MNNTVQSSGVDRKELPTFQASKCQFPSYPRLRVPMEGKGSSNVPISKHSEDRFLWYIQARNTSTTKARSHFRGEKLENPIYEETLGKKVPLAEIVEFYFEQLTWNSIALLTANCTVCRFFLVVDRV